MTLESHKLEKNITSHKHANENYAKNFNHLAKSSDPIDEDKIIEIYDQLLYDISIEGKDSHKTLTELSYDVLYYQYNEQLNSQIRSLIETLGVYNKTLADLTHPGVKEHPVYEDGSFLIGGENGEKYQDMHTVWIMQEGLKRPIASTEVYMKARKALGLGEDWTGLYYLTIANLNSINDGATLDTDSSFHMKGEELKVDGTYIFGVSAYVDVDFTCKGNEIEDVWNLVLGDDPEAAGHFYLNGEGCKIYYINDELSNDELGPVVEELLLAKNETKRVRLLRDIELGDLAGFGINNMPNNMQQYYNEYANPEAEITYNGTNVANYIRLWGSGQQYPGVVYAEGRIMKAEVYAAAISNEYYAQDTSVQIFNGLPTEGSGFWDVDNQPSDLGNQYFGSLRRIYMPESGLWGALNQSTSLQSKFDSSGFNYYRSDVRKNAGFNIGSWIRAKLPSWLRWAVGDIWIFRSAALPVYGQPIIYPEGKSDYYGALGLKSWGISIYVPWPVDKTYRYAWEFVQIYKYSNGEIFQKVKSKAKGYGFHIKMTSNGYIHGLDWTKVKSSEVAYVGHKGVGYGYTGEDIGKGNDNPFNPNTGGSNYELNSHNTP